MKTGNLLLLCLLWIYAHSFAGNKPDAYLYLKVPSNINTEKYNYHINTKYVNVDGNPFGCHFSWRKDPEQIVVCKIWGHADTLVNIEFVVESKQGGRGYVYHKAQVKITSDSVFYAIPELPAEEEVDNYIEAVNKAYKKEHRGEDFIYFMTDWKSYFIYANFFQGNRPYGEISFSNARYDDVPESLFSRYHEPGFIRGPVYGAEFKSFYFRNYQTAAYFVSTDGLVNFGWGLKKLFPNRIKESDDFPRKLYKQLKKTDPGRIF